LHLSIHLNAAESQAATIIGKELTTHHAAYYKLATYFLRMAELALVDYFVMGEAIGIVATLFVSFYFSRRQMQKLSIDIETKVLSDLDEKIHGLTQLAVEKPQLIRIVSNCRSRNWMVKRRVRCFRCTLQAQRGKGKRILAIAKANLD
jgi:hypothetical protein